jgi:hypothetical protein
MNHRRRLQEPKIGAELIAERSLAVSHDWQSAASFRPRRSEGGYDEMAPRVQGPAKGIDIPLTISSRDEEVEHGSIVPERIAPFGLECRHILP